MSDTHDQITRCLAAARAQIAHAPQRPPPEHRALMLRTCTAQMGAHGGFTWPAAGYVEALDWDPAPRCGGGLHGLLWGEGDAGLLDWSRSARWLAVEIDAREIVDLGGKIKVPRGWVVCCGDRPAATAHVAAHGGTGRSIVGGTAAAGYGGTATAGDYGTATAGYGGTATAGYGGTATAGDYGTATAGGGGELRIRWWDGQRYRLAVGYVGEGGILPSVAYHCDERGQIARVQP